MKKTLFLALSLFCSQIFTAQSPDFVWVKQMSGTSGETPIGIDLDASGNIYTSGYFKGTVDFDPGPGTYTLEALGDEAVYASKLDAQGNFLWAKAFRPPVQIPGTKCHAYSQVLSSSGDLYITGSFEGVIDFDPAAPNVILYSPNANIFIAKLDAQGNYLWAKSIGGTSGDYGMSVAVDASNAVYTTGFFVDTVDFDPSPASVYKLISGPLNPQSFVSKLDASGNFVWAKQLATYSVSIPTAISLDANGNVYTTGSFDGNADFDPGVNSYTLNSQGDQDVYVWKLDASGNFIWAKTMGGVTKEAGVDLINDASGNVYVTGFFTGTGDFDPGIGTQNLTSAGNNDYFITKLDALGNLVWVKALGGPGNEVASSLALDQSGAIYYTGEFANTVDFDPSAGTQTLTTTGRNSFISKMDNAGNFKWVKQLEGANYSAGSDLTIDAMNNVYSVGAFSTTIDFDANAGTYTLTSTGDEDVYIHKMLCGNPPAINATSSSSLICAGNSATLTPSGATSYSWNASAGNVLVITPSITSTYALLATDANGCSSSLNITQQVSNCTGIEKNGNAESKIKVYPNPSQGVLFIEAEFTSEGSVAILNTLGEVVKTQRLTKSQTQLNIESLSDGIYFVRISQNNILLTQLKIVKN